MKKNLLKKTLQCAIATSMALNFNLNAMMKEDQNGKIQSFHQSIKKSKSKLTENCLIIVS